MKGFYGDDARLMTDVIKLANIMYLFLQKPIEYKKINTNLKLLYFRFQSLGKVTTGKKFGDEARLDPKLFCLWVKIFEREFFCNYKLKKSFKLHFELFT